MKSIGLFIPSKIPVLGYGGTERAIFWLGKGLARRGIRVSFICKEGSHSEFADCIPLPTLSSAWATAPLNSIDLIHFMTLPPANFPIHDKPYLVTIQGNGKPNEIFPHNSVFVSRNHAQRHNWSEFVYNGLDLDEYPFDISEKNERLLFLAKARWRVKNLEGALRIAKKAKKKIDVAGGNRGWKTLFDWHARFHGDVGGPQKQKLLRQSQALLFPVIWDEPFGIALTEALASGLAVFGTQRGSLPEIVSPDVGFLSNDENELADAILTRRFSPEACRARVEQYFSLDKMVDDYLACYTKILSQGKLRDGQPKTRNV